jgi:citrate synthase
VQTLYVYVSRKGIRSQAIPGARQRRYWKADVDRVARRDRAAAPVGSQVREESKITLLTDGGLYYRGQKATDLAERASFEHTAALLWGFPEEEVFKTPAPKVPNIVSKLHRLLSEESDINRAAAFLPLFEECNPRSYDMSPTGMARTGADVLRTIAALAVGSSKPTTEPIHKYIALHLGGGPALADLVRRQLILAGDHGFESGALAVRALASAGVTPWRAVIAGLSVTLGCRTRLSRWGAVNRLLTEIVAAQSPTQPILDRLRAGEGVPGFDAPLHPHGDPRARSLLAACADIFPRDPAYQRLAEAISFARSVQGLEPSFALACLFVDSRTGLRPGRSLFHVGRCAGWIAHAIEQFNAGEPARTLGVYKGELPQG